MLEQKSVLLGDTICAVDGCYEPRSIWDDQGLTPHFYASFAPTITDKYFVDMEITCPRTRIEAVENMIEQFQIGKIHPEFQILILFVDRWIDADAIFQDTLHESGRLSDGHYKTCQDALAFMQKHSPKIAGTIVLDSSIDVMMERLKKRGAIGDDGISREYNAM